MEFYHRGTASVIIDGQYGSTGKGLLAGYLAMKSKEGGHVIHTTNAAPNAGHTTVWTEAEPMGGGTIDKTLTTFHLPTGGVMRPGNLCHLNSGSIIEIDRLIGERRAAEELLRRHIHLMVDPMAAVLTLEDREYEMEAGSQMGNISSTRKGVGRALARKVMREAKLAKDWPEPFRDANIVVNKLDLNNSLQHGSAVSIEVPQGLSLGLNHGMFYPYCTSREVSVAQAMSDAGVHPRFLGCVALSMRTFPIRVGSLPGATSGGHYHDQKELQWSDIGVEPELTTVTRRPRRIFTWSRQQYRDALRKTMPSIVFLNFCNYFRSVQQFEDHVASMIEDNDIMGIKPAMLFGFGPNVADVLAGSFDDASAEMLRLIHATEV